MVALTLIVAVANAGILTQSIVEPLVKSAALQGPSSRSTVVGPDGSVIDSVAPGGRIETAVDAGFAAYTAPVVTAAHLAPAHVVAHTAPAAAVVAARSAVVATPHAFVSHTVPSAVVSGPSGAIVAHAAPSVVSARYATVNGYVPAVRTLVASPLTASGYPLFAAGSGLEGQYVPDNLEQLYDDGSYKGEIYP